MFPWEENTSEVYEGAWVMSTEKKVLLDDEEELDIAEFGVNLKGVRELFRSWSQYLMIKGL